MLPVYYNDGARVPEGLTRSIVASAVQFFGGATLGQKVRGYWYSDYTGKTYEEDMQPLVIIDTGDHGAEGAEFVERLAHRVARKFGQECVMVTQDQCNVSFPDGSIR
jgi:hypothetical protein